MDRRSFLGTAGAGVAAALWSRERLRAAEPTDRPNIILIFSDDVGIGDIGAFGGSFSTPRIDALAKSGVQFTHAYSTPLCGPSRCQTLTGRYPFRTGLISNASQNAVSPEREVMIPTVLAKAGYATASVGKWGQICLGPKEWGFGEHLVFSGSGRYWASQANGAYTVNGQAKTLRADEYLPDTMHDFAVDFMKRHVDQPFFLYYPMSHVHGPIMRTPDSKPGADAKQLYADNVAYMDKLVGRLVDEVERLGLRGKTVILFTGDNGTARFGPTTVDGKRLSGQKATLLEGGSRVPLLASWPGHTPAGGRNDDLVDFSDFFGTFAELAGASLPAGVTIDSQSFAPVLAGRPGKPREWVYVELNGKGYAADHEFKLTSGGELFDLAKAPFEEIAVAAGTETPAAKAARAKLQAVLATHQPMALDDKTKAAIDKQRQRRQQQQRNGGRAGAKAGAKAGGKRKNAAP